MKAYNVLGVKIHAVTASQALDKLNEFLQETGGPSRLVVTVGPEMVMRAQQDEQFRELVNQADLVVADGTGILWAANRCGVHFPERVAGIDLITKFADTLAAQHRKLFLLGAAPGVAELASQKLQQLQPNLEIGGTHDGYFKLSEIEPVVQQVKNSQAAALYVGMGSPTQERIISEYGKAMGIRLGVGVGGSFDVLSGKKKRAPQWMIKMRLEWLYRFMCEPQRVGRMLAIPKFMWLTISQGRQAVTAWTTGQ